MREKKSKERGLLAPLRSLCNTEKQILKAKTKEKFAPCFGSWLIVSNILYFPTVNRTKPAGHSDTGSGSTGKLHSRFNSMRFKFHQLPHWLLTPGLEIAWAMVFPLLLCWSGWIVWICQVSRWCWICRSRDCTLKITLAFSDSQSWLHVWIPWRKKKKLK